MRSLVPEDGPLGTGGALGNCRDVVSGTFACFNGDIISSLDVNSLLSLHKSNQGIGTIGLWEVEDPTRFGIVGLDDNSKITRFKEKPTKEEVFSNLINAGSYIFEDDIFDWIPQGKSSIERDVFPILAEDGLLNGQKFEGYFVDAGTRQSWSNAVRTCIENKMFSHGEVCGSSWFSSPFSKVEDESLIVDSMIEENIEIKKSNIDNSTILSGSRISENVIIESSLIGKNVIIGSNCQITDVIVDHDSIIPPGTILNGGQWPLID